MQVQTIRKDQVVRGIPKLDRSIQSGELNLETGATPLAGADPFVRIIDGLDIKSEAFHPFGDFTGMAAGNQNMFSNAMFSIAENTAQQP